MIFVRCDNIQCREPLTSAHVEVGGLHFCQKHATELQPHFYDIASRAERLKDELVQYAYERLRRSR